MLFAALVLSLAAPPAAPAPSAQTTQQAECLKRCAGQPKEASGQRLMACLQQCEVQNQRCKKDCPAK